MKKSSSLDDLKLIEVKNPPKKSKIETSIYWWLNYKRPFVIDDKYSIHLLEIDRFNGSAKILIQNIENKSGSEKDADKNSQELNIQLTDLMHSI